MNQTGLLTIFQQHKHYMQRHGLYGTPWELFRLYFVSAVSSWLEHGDRIIIFIDANEHILNGTLPNDLHSLGLLEATHKHWAKDEPRTYVHGNGAPIGGVFHMPDLEITLVLQLFFREGAGNHRMVIVDISSSAIGKFEC
jgi:hypothetical protein